VRIVHTQLSASAWRAGTWWQGRFRSVIVQKQGYLQRLGHYIERNPVRAGIVERPWDYRFSSTTAYVNGRDDTLVRIADHPFYWKMGATDPDRAELYSQYLLTARERAEEESVFKGGQLAVGDEDFCRQTYARTDQRPTSRRVGRSRKWGK